MWILNKIFFEHSNSTNNPQGYWTHGSFSVGNSIKGMFAMIAGIIHGIIPILFPFTTSSWIIRSFVKLVNSDRHIEEIEKYVSREVVFKLYTMNLKRND